MLDKILVPIDGSEIFQEILAYLKQLGERPRTEIILLHVQTPGDGHDANDAAGHPLLKGYYDALSENGWNVRAEIRTGDTVDEISLCAAQTEAAMIMMSTHGRTGMDRIREGSVTEQVLKQSPCPVFVLHSTRAEPSDHRNEELFRRILVPLDGTEASAAVLSCVERLAKAHNSEVIIFHDEMVGPEDEDKRAAIKAALQDQSVELANTGLKVTLDMSTYKRPIREILKKIDDMEIDLVSMASHGESGVRRSMEESVTAEVIRHANCPLLVWSADPQCPLV